MSRTDNGLRAKEYVRCKRCGSSVLDPEIVRERERLEREVQRLLKIERVAGYALARIKDFGSNAPGNESADVARQAYEDLWGAAPIQWVSP